jgi:hypothetical protein
VPGGPIQLSKQKAWIMPRKPRQQPATFYEWRRPILICQLLATGATTAQWQALARKWDITIDDLSGDLAGWLLMERLAQHALEHARQQEYDDVS